VLCPKYNIPHGHKVAIPHRITAHNIFSTPFHTYGSPQPTTYSITSSHTDEDKMVIVIGKPIPDDPYEMFTAEL
jgi:hypothetical protein